MQRMHERMDSIFGDFFINDPFSTIGQNLLIGTDTNNRNMVSSNYTKPLSDIYETEGNIIADIEMPGIDKKDIFVDIDEDGISVKAQTKYENKDDNKKQGTYRFERNYTGFSRYFSLPKNVDTSKAFAEYKNGLLKITVPKINVGEQQRKRLDVK